MTSNADAVERETPTGCVAIEGYFDRFSQRVDLKTGEIVEDKSLGAARDSERKVDAARRTLVELDLKLVRPLSELAIDPANAAARQVVEQLVAEKEIERGKLPKPKGSREP